MPINKISFERNGAYWARVTLDAMVELPAMPTTHGEKDKQHYEDCILVCLKNLLPYFLVRPPAGDPPCTS